MSEKRPSINPSKSPEQVATQMRSITERAGRLALLTLQAAEESGDVSKMRDYRGQEIDNGSVILQRRNSEFAQPTTFNTVITTDDSRGTELSSKVSLLSDHKRRQDKLHTQSTITELKDGAVVVDSFTRPLEGGMNRSTVVGEDKLTILPDNKMKVFEKEASVDSSDQHFPVRDATPEDITRHLRTISRHRGKLASERAHFKHIKRLQDKRAA